MQITEEKTHTYEHAASLLPLLPFQSFDLKKANDLKSENPLSTTIPELHRIAPHGCTTPSMLHICYTQKNIV